MKYYYKQNVSIQLEELNFHALKSRFRRMLKLEEFIMKNSVIITKN